MKAMNTPKYNSIVMMLVAAGCGAFGIGPVSSAFDIRFEPNNKETVAQVSKTLQQQTQQSAKGSVPTNSLGKPVALVIKAGKPATLALFLVDEGRALWTKQVTTSSKPTLLYDTVILKEDKILVGLKITDGTEKWRFDTEAWDYFGAHQSTDTVFVTLGIGGECRKSGLHRGRILALNAGSGMVLWERETSGHCLGAPSSYAGYVFIPNDMQSISVLRAADGVEEARLLSLDDNFTFVASFPEGVFYGSKGLYTFNASSYAGLKKGDYVLQVKSNDPVQLTLTSSEGLELTLYRSKGGAPPGFEDKPTPLGKWEMGQDRFLLMNPDGTFKVIDKRGELTTLQKKGSIFVGGEGKFTAEAKTLSFKVNASAYYHPPLGKIPGEPELYKDRISPVIGISNARDKIRLIWAPQGVPEGGTVKLLENVLCLMYYRFIFAFDATTGALRWAYRSSLDLEDVEAGAGGIFLIDRKGDITCLDIKTGQLKGKIPTAIMVTAATLSVGSYVPQFPKISGETLTLRDELVEMILDKDNRLVPIRQFALGFLAKIEEPEVTRDLLTIYMSNTVPEEIKSIARQKILERESGAAYIIEAMQYHYDYLNEVSPPPVGVVAQALVKMKAKEGVLPLIQHLLDHETSLQDLKEVAQAILQLGDETVVPSVSDYLVRYHADSAFNKDLDALFVLANVIHTHGGVEGDELLKKLQADPKTTKALANAIKEIFDKSYQDEVAAKMKKDTEGAAVEGAVEEKVEAGKEYQTLTQKQIKEVLGPHNGEFLPCIQDYMEKVPTMSQVRLKFILNNAGKVENLLTLPNDPSLSSCLMGVLLKVKWPKIKQLKQTAQYIIAVEKKKQETTPEWPPQPVPVEPKPEPKPQPEPKQPPPTEWLPQPEPVPLPQPALPQPKPQPKPDEKKPKPDEKKPKPDEPPNVEDYPDVLPEDLPEKK
jgi:outer membrane protein assembly factor BamB